MKGIHCYGPSLPSCTVFSSFTFATPFTPIYLIYLHISALCSIFLYNNISNTCPTDRFYNRLHFSSNPWHCIVFSKIAYRSFLHNNYISFLIPFLFQAIEIIIKASICCIGNWPFRDIVHSIRYTVLQME